MGDYFRGIGKSVLTDALILGFSAAVPPAGAVLIPAYTALNYSKLGYSLYKAYDQYRTEGSPATTSVANAADEVGETAAQPSADAIGSNVASTALQAGAFTELTTQTGLSSAVFAEMVKGSTSSALTAIGGDLLKFAVGSAVGG